MPLSPRLDVDAQCASAHLTFKAPRWAIEHGVLSLPVWAGLNSGVIQGYSAKPFESLQLPTVEDPDKAWFMSNVYCKAQPGWGQQQQHHTLTRKPHTNTKLTKEKKDRQRETGTLCMSVNHSANTQTLHSDPRYIYSVVLLKLLLKCPNSLKSFLSKSMMQLCLHLLATIWHCT